MRGIDLFLECLGHYGVEYIFGNPGTTELPLSDAIARQASIQYRLGLQEIPVMGMADGYAMASGKLGVVNLHTACGLGNAMGLLFNAYREGTPLLVTAGQQDRRLQIQEPILYGDLVAAARPWTKAAMEVSRLEDLPVAVHRLAQAALTPPTGPVFLALPLDLQLETWTAPPPPRRALPTATFRAPAESIEQAAELLASANHPAIIAGSRTTSLGAIEPLVALAEQIGATVFGEPLSNHGRSAFPSCHPLYARNLPLWAPDIHAMLEGFDTLLVVGMDLIRLYIHYEPPLAIPSHLRVIHLDEDARELGKNYVTDVGLWGHARSTLDELVVETAARQSALQQTQVQARRDTVARSHADIRDQLREQVANATSESTLNEMNTMGILADALTEDTAVVEAAVTTTQSMLERLGAITRPEGYFGQRGWTLGWGLNVAMGVKIAWPERPVLGIVGDGAAMYGIQGLWSAAHYRIPVTWVICNNQEYRILKQCATGIGLPDLDSPATPDLTLRDPAIDFVQLASALGVSAQRVETPAQLREAMFNWTDRETPQVIEAVLAPPVQR